MKKETGILSYLPKSKPVRILNYEQMVVKQLKLQRATNELPFDWSHCFANNKWNFPVFSFVFAVKQRTDGFANFAVCMPELSSSAVCARDKTKEHCRCHLISLIMSCAKTVYDIYFWLNFVLMIFSVLSVCFNCCSSSVFCLEFFCG